MSVSAAQHTSKKKFDIDTELTTAEEKLYAQFYQHKPQLQLLIEKRCSVYQSAPPAVTSAPVAFSPPTPLSSQLTEEELILILQKLHEVAQLPSPHLEHETELYLEQQLSDVLGFEISSSLNDCRLQFSKGLLKSLSHLPLDPMNKAIPPTQIHEAGKQQNRSFFGWQHTNLHDQDDHENLEYWVSVPLQAVQTAHAESKNWLLHKKMIIINTADALCVVASVLDTFMDVSNKYQLGGSPAVVRNGLLWSPQNLGKFLCFFVPDQDSYVSTGVYSLAVK